jgi:hypothetical protein
MKLFLLCGNHTAAKTDAARDLNPDVYLDEVVSIRDTDLTKLAEAVSTMNWFNEQGGCEREFVVVATCLDSQAEDQAERLWSRTGSRPTVITVKPRCPVTCHLSLPNEIPFLPEVRLRRPTARR